MKRVGLLGGMFDPPHRGHVAMAERALNRLQLDELHFVPCHVPNHRDAAKASPQQRCDMLVLACSGLAAAEQMKVDEWELHREQVSYWADTLAHFQAELPDCQLISVSGMDSFASLPSWDRPGQLLQCSHWYVLAREQQGMGDALQELITENSRLADSIDDFLLSPPAVFVDRGFDEPGSSTAVREALRNGRPDTRLPAAVAAYISRHGLYQA